MMWKYFISEILCLLRLAKHDFYIDTNSEMLISLLLTVPCLKSHASHWIPCLSLNPTPLTKSNPAKSNTLPPLCLHLQCWPILSKNTTRQLVTPKSMLSDCKWLLTVFWQLYYSPSSIHSYSSKRLFLLFQCLTLPHFSSRLSDILVLILLKGKPPQGYMTTSVHLPMSVLVTLPCLLLPRMKHLTPWLDPILSWTFKLSPPALLPSFPQLHFLFCRIICYSLCLDAVPSSLCQRVTFHLRTSSTTLCPVAFPVFLFPLSTLFSFIVVITM